MRGDFDEDEEDDTAVTYALALMESAHRAAAPQGAIAINRLMVRLKAMATRYEDCIRHHSRTCTCGITEAQCVAYAAAEAADGDPDCTTGRAPRTPVSLELVDDLVVALRSLAYAAMTSGGTKGPDGPLKDAIRWATDAIQKYDTRAGAIR